MNDYENQNKTILERMGKVKRKIAILSGKGGVGKSFLTSAIAERFAKEGNTVGILDADITGPSIPAMFGIKKKPAVLNGKLVPPKSSSGLKVMSIDLLSKRQGQPFVWRGPLISGAIRQFLSEVEWGELDYLFVDLPPGTSDASLTIMQSIPLDGLVIISTPQNLVYSVVEKSINMAKIMNVPILGIVENMNGMECPHCKKLLFPFGDIVKSESSNENGILVLGNIRFDPKISSLCDEGKISDYSARGIDEIVKKMKLQLGVKI